MLQCVAVCCSVLQCVAVCCSVVQCESSESDSGDSDDEPSPVYERMQMMDVL